MGLIREPNGVDFIIAPASYTDADKAIVSDFFRKNKASKIKKIVEPYEIRTKRKVFA
jgi:hypothetical protein